MKKIICLFIAAVFLSCNHQSGGLPENFDYGVTENGRYTNDYFNMEILFNSDWVVQSKQQMAEIAELGEEAIGGDDENFKAMLKASEVNTADLLAVFKYGDEVVTDFNPSFMVVAENIKNFPEVKNGNDYLMEAKKLLSRAQVQYYFEKDVFERKIGQLTFHVMETKLDYAGLTIIQEYSSTVLNGFTVSFVVSYTTDDQRDELYTILDNVKM